MSNENTCTPGPVQGPDTTRDALMLQMLDLKTAAYNVLLDYIAAIEAMEFEDEAAESTELAEALQKALTRAEEVL